MPVNSVQFDGSASAKSFTANNTSSSTSVTDVNSRIETGEWEQIASNSSTQKLTSVNDDNVDNVPDVVRDVQPESKKASSEALKSYGEVKIDIDHEEGAATSGLEGNDSVTVPTNKMANIAENLKSTNHVIGEPAEEEGFGDATEANPIVHPRATTTTPSSRSHIPTVCRLQNSCRFIEMTSFFVGRRYCAAIYRMMFPHAPGSAQFDREIYMATFILLILLFILVCIAISLIPVIILS